MMNKFKNIIKTSKEGNDKKIKNEFLLKRGGYSIIISAIVLVGLIVLNWLMGVLADRFNLEYDMTTDQKNSISEENIEYIKNLDADITVTVCGAEEDFATYMAYYAQNYYGITITSGAEAEYFEQTVKLLSKYNDYNDRITIKYVDPQSTEFTSISSKYSDIQLAFGDMLVTSTVNGQERLKHLTVEDIYVFSTDQSSSYYSSTTISASKLESSLTSAIAYVTSKEIKKVAVISSHSNNDYTEAYKELLEINSYEITEIDDTIVNKIPNEYDAVIISAPTTDFVAEEIDALSTFLENDGKLGKGLIFFADASCPQLPNLNTFLKQWGIEVGEGLVFETNDSNHMVGDPTAIGIYQTTTEDGEKPFADVDATTPAVAGYVVPMKVCETASSDITATSIMQTSDTAVLAPVGSPLTWADYTDDDLTQFDAIIQSEISRYDNENDNEHLTSYIMAFSSVEFVQSVYATDESYSAFCNQEAVLACTERAAHKANDSYTFTSKVITGESFYSEITEKDTKTVGIIFMGLIPVALIAAGIVIFIMRRKSV